MKRPVIYNTSVIHGFTIHGFDYSDYRGLGNSGKLRTMRAKNREFA